MSHQAAVCCQHPVLTGLFNIWRRPRPDTFWCVRGRAHLPPNTTSLLNLACLTCRIKSSCQSPSQSSIHMANICWALSICGGWALPVNPELALKSRVQGPRHDTPLTVCHHVRAPSSQPSRVPALPRAPYQGARSPPLHSPSPTLHSRQQPDSTIKLCPATPGNSHLPPVPFQFPWNEPATATALGSFAARTHAIKEAGAICNSWLPGRPASNSKEHKEASARDGELVYPDLEFRLI